MLLTNRSGAQEKVDAAEIRAQLARLAYGLAPAVELEAVVSRVLRGLSHGMNTAQVSQLAAQEAAYLSGSHPDYGRLAGRIAMEWLHKETPARFSECCAALSNVQLLGRDISPLAPAFNEFVQQHAAELDTAIVSANDFEFDYFGFKTLERSYLLKANKKIVERPQYMFMRVSVAIHLGDMPRILETYRLMSSKFFIHATPTLFNAGLKRQQLSSCFLLQMVDDSIEGIFDTLKECAVISKYAGGIGLAIHKIRATNAYIAGTNGRSNGIVPMLRVFNATARYVDQGGGKRKGGFAIYLEPWHADIFEFIELRRNHGNEELRTRDLFLGLYINDLFMRRVDEDGVWSLMCPARSPGLFEVWGAEFDALYTRYEAEQRFVRQVKARALWTVIVNTQIETGNPYLVYKDACNRKSNQRNLGTIQSSNLCTEVVQYTSREEIAVCNLASLSLPAYVDVEKRRFNYEKLFEVAKIVTHNLNNVIDVGFYVTEKARRSNLRHRPIGIGVQGFADALQLLRLPFDSPEANEVNKNIFETIYFGAVTASVELAKEHGPYSSFEGSPASEGSFQFDLWNEERRGRNLQEIQLSGMWDWAELREAMVKYGLRNSLLVAPMPTASTSQILGNCESFEPYTSNVFTRRVLSGEFCVLNKHLVLALSKLGLWSEALKQQLIAHNGSVQLIEEIPQPLKALFKTTWEIKQRNYIDMSVARAPFICQSQSLSLFAARPSFGALTSMHFYAWKQGLKTGLYYLRIQSATDAIKFTVDPTTLRSAKDAQSNAHAPENAENKKPDAKHVPMCSLLNPGCVSCSG